MTCISCGTKLIKYNWIDSGLGAVKGVVIMTNRKTFLRLTLALVCSAAILWLGVGCGKEVDPDYQCGTESLRQANRTNEVFHKYNSLFNRYPSPQCDKGILEGRENWRQNGNMGNCNPGDKEGEPGGAAV